MGLSSVATSTVPLACAALPCVHGPEAGDRTGLSAEAAGDTDGDGLSELLIGAWKDGGGYGGVFLVAGRPATR